MKVQIRRGVFETNSSSVHTLTIASKTDWDKFKKGEFVIKDYPYDITFVNAKSISPDKIYDVSKKEDEENFYDYDYISYDVFFDLWDSEILVKEKSNIVAISIYKYD